MISETPRIAANAPIEELDFTPGTYNALRSIGIETVAQLAARTEAELMQEIPLKRSPHKRVDEVKVVLQRNGRFLAG